MNSLRPNPSLARALRKACKVFFAHPVQVMLFLLVQVTIRLAAFAPLLFLLIPGYQAGALLVIPAYVLVVIPARQRAAYAYRSMLHGGDLFIPQLGVGWRPYPGILGKGLRTGVCLLPWIAPLAAAVIWLVTFWKAEGVQGQTDGITVIRSFLAFGGGDPMRALLYAALIAGGLILCAAAGCAFHSGARHDFTQDRRMIRGLKHRGRAVTAWLAGVGLFIPFAAMTAFLLLGMFRGLLHGVVGQLTGGGEQEVAAIQQTASEAAARVTAGGNNWRYAMMGAGFVLLVLPMTVLKGLFSAAAVDSLWENA